MAKFLNETGLSYFWGKVKEFLKSKYVGIGDDITIGSGLYKTVLNSLGLKVTNDDVNTETILDADTGLAIGTYTDSSKETIDSITNVAADGINIVDYTEHTGISVSKKGIISTDDIDNVDSDNLANNEGSIVTPDLIQVKDGQNKLSIRKVSINISDENGNSAKITTNDIRIADDSGSSTITSTDITSKKFVKTGGTNNQVLLADGSIATLNAANGIPKLDANGRIPLSQLGNLDTTLFEVVTALPTTNIKKNRIYLLKSSTTATQNLYAEYVYTGDVSATYDASKWEKLGEYKSDVDLSNYSKKSETLTSMVIERDNTAVGIISTMADKKTTISATIPYASTSAAGVMTSSDKKALDTLTARYPLSIATFTASPSLVEVGASTDITFSWTLNNTDFHPITAQGIVVDGAASVSVDKATKTYKKTGLAGATTATTKSATLTVNGSLTKSVNVTYHYPSYIGVVANGTSITETVVKGLTKSIEWGKGKTATLTQSNQQIVYAYPASYGDLTSIKDGNGFEGFAGYTKSTLTVGGQTYNVYKQTLPATASSKYTFA